MREDERLHLVNADGTVSFFVASGRENDKAFTITENSVILIEMWEAYLT